MSGNQDTECSGQAVQKVFVKQEKDLVSLQYNFCQAVSLCLLRTLFSTAADY